MAKRARATLTPDCISTRCLPSYKKKKATHLDHDPPPDHCVLDVLVRLRADVYASASCQLVKFTVHLTSRMNEVGVGLSSFFFNNEEFN